MGIALIILGSLAGLVVLGNVFTYPLQHWFIMWPTRQKPSLEWQFKMREGRKFEEVWLDGHAGGRINAVHFRVNPVIRKGVVLYFHGNSGSIKKWEAVRADFLDRGWDLFLVDFRGYGKSKGRRSEKNLYLDAQVAYAHVKREFPAEKIIIYGRSLGSGVASNLATRVAARRLVLETPFHSIRDLFYSYYPIFPKIFVFRYKFPNHRHLEETSMPVIIYHGTKDRVVPYKCAARLKKYLKEEDEFVTIFGAGHNDLADYDAFNASLDEILN